MPHTDPEPTATDFDTVVIGAGVVGLATARLLALAGQSVLIIEQASRFGDGTSSRNSEVIHAGLYYPPGSLKARLCVQGRDKLYAYAAARAVGHARCGKLVVAQDAAERQALDVIAARAAACGARVQVLDRAAVQEREPRVQAQAGALWSPDSGIVDSHALMTALLGDAQAHGAELVTRTALVGAHRAGTGAGARWVLGLATLEPSLGWQGLGLDGRPRLEPRFANDRGPDAPPADADEALSAATMSISTRHVVNAAGLWGVPVARLLARAGGPAPSTSTSTSPSHTLPAPRFALGRYAALDGRSPFGCLVYPVPEPGGLGVHLTLDLMGQARFGPDVQWLPEGTEAGAIDYRVGDEVPQRFIASIRRYWPEAPLERLHAAYAGARPKLVGPGQTDADFRIDGVAEHGRAGCVDLLGIESPGLTAALAIAPVVLQHLGIAQPPDDATQSAGSA